jgi:hypothetical protein
VSTVDRAAADDTTLEFGGNYTGDPGSNYALRLDPSNARFGLLGFSEASNGRGIVGRATADSGTTIGVIGRSDSSSDGATGLMGFNEASSGRTYGFRGRSDSTEGRGALGIATADSGDTIGLEGRTDSPDGVGVSGTNTASSGTTYGVVGRVNSADGYGLYTPDDAVIDGKLHASNLDTSDDSSLVLESNGSQGLKLQAATDGEYVNVVGGASVNEVEDGVGAATIAGGGWTGPAVPEEDVKNLVTAGFGSIGGGVGNTVSGGYGVASGGRDNTVDGRFATVPGGDENTADGDYSLAAGRKADTNGHHGAFVFGDSTSDAIQAQNDDEVRSQMPIYAPAFNTTSARSEKTAIEPVDPRAVLAGVESLSVSTWTFDREDEGRHMGPMAGEFAETFDLGDDAETIATVDADGVALAAIQGLAEKLEETTQDLDEKDERIETLEAENEALRDRLLRVEDHLDLDGASGRPPSTEH